jgi:NADH-quinone oxidoreductase E subunit
MIVFPSFEPTPEWRKRADEIAAPYPMRQAALIPLLTAIQEEHGCISEAAESWAAEFLEVPPIRVREVMSFYTMFRREPRGRHHIRLCRNVSCHLMGSESVAKCLEKKLGCPPGERTRDGEFSWELVECLGACELAPMLQIDEAYVGFLTPESIDRILKDPPTLDDLPESGSLLLREPGPDAAIPDPPRKPAASKKPGRKKAAKKKPKSTARKKPTPKKSTRKKGGRS